MKRTLILLGLFLSLIAAGMTIAMSLQGNEEAWAGWMAASVAYLLATFLQDGIYDRDAMLSLYDRMVGVALKQRDNALELLQNRPLDGDEWKHQS